MSWKTIIIRILFAMFMFPFACASAGAQVCETVGVNIGSPDAEGKLVVTFVLPNDVRPVRLGPPPGISRHFCSFLPGGYRITKVRTFIGLDRGAVAEVALDAIVGGQVLYSRSMHKETTSNYESWSNDPVDYLMPGGPNALHLLVRGWTTDGRQPQAGTGMEPGLIVELKP